MGSFLAPFSGAFLPVRAVARTPDLRILAPYFFDIYVKLHLDLKRPLTNFDKTGQRKWVAIRAGCQEEMGALWVGRPPVEDIVRDKGQGPTWPWEVPKQARIRQLACPAVRTEKRSGTDRFSHFSALLFDTLVSTGN